MADIFDAATGTTTRTLLTCSAGGTINETINPLSTTCAVGCKIRALYQQVSGASAGDAEQATNALRPAYTANTFGTKPGVCFTAASTQYFVLANSPAALAQPWSTAWWGKRTGNTGTFASVFDGGIDGGAYNNTANTIVQYAGTSSETLTVSDNTAHAIFLIYNGASSQMCSGGTCTTKNPGTNGITNATTSFGRAAWNSSYLEGCIGEWAYFGSGPTTGSASTLSTNMAAYWQ